jgi:hypothetical protein
MNSLLVILLLIFPAAFASAQESECELLTREALELSGFNADISADSQLMNSAELVQQVVQSWRLPPNSAAVVQEAFRKGLEPESVKSELQRLVSAECEPVKMRQLVQQLRSPVVVQMNALESISKTPEGRNSIRAYMQVHGREIPSLPRMAALQKMDNALGMTEFHARHSLAVQSGMAEGMGIKGAQNMKSSYINPWYRDAIAGDHLQVMLAIYHSASDQEVRQYAQILSSEPVKRFYALVMRSLLTLHERRGKLVGEEIKDRLPPGSIDPAAISIGAAGTRH